MRWCYPGAIKINSWGFYKDEGSGEKRLCPMYRSPLEAVISHLKSEGIRELVSGELINVLNRKNILWEAVQLG